MTVPSTREILMSTAILWSARSKCSRLKVGAVIADTTLETFVVGYNGTYKNGPNECVGDVDKPGGCGCVHAEANAIAKAGRGEKIAFLTHAPCRTCAFLMINAGVSQLYYNSVYRSDEGLKWLAKAGVRIHKLQMRDTDGFS